LGFVGERLQALVFTPRDGGLHVIGLHQANQRELKRNEKSPTLS